MPRVVNTQAEESNSNMQARPDCDDELDVNENTNQRIAFTEEANLYRTSNPFHGQHVYYSSVNVNGEDDPYCLRRVIDGKVKKFKKDTRTWLHKSSSKIKRKSEENNSERPHSEFQYFIQGCGVSGNSNLLDIRENSIKYGAIPKLDGAVIPLKRASPLSPIRELENRERDEYMMYRSTTETPEMDVDELVSSLGDSDAEIIYSEESTPTKTLSYVDNWRQAECKSVSFDLANNINIPHQQMTSQSDFELISGDVDPEDINLETECCGNAQVSNGCRCCNESGNNVRGALTRCDITQNIAPAIQLEDESLREAQLDYLVNTDSRRVDLRTPYFTRQQSRAKMQKICLPKGFPQKKTAKQNARKSAGTKKRAAKKANRPSANEQKSSIQTAQTSASQNSGSYDASFDSEEPGCSCYSVPSLFVLASRVMFRRSKVKFENSK